MSVEKEVVDMCYDYNKDGRGMQNAIVGEYEARKTEKHIYIHIKSICICNF